VVSGVQVFVEERFIRASLGLLHLHIGTSLGLADLHIGTIWYVFTS
jgi:hypothetical protein